MVGLVQLRPAEDETRIKGSVGVRVLRAGDGQPTTRAAVGERVVLSVARGVFRHAVVLEQADDGTVGVVWPATGGSQRLDDAVSEVRLEPGFEVAPGSVTLHVFFDDAPLDVERIRASQQGGSAHAQVRLEVAP